MKRQSTFYPLWGVLFLAVAFASCGQENKETVPDGEESGAEQAPVEDTQPQLSQEQEYIEVNIDTLRSLKQGDQISMENTRRSETYNLVIRRVQETMPGLISISANIEDRDNGLATLILRDNDRLSGMLQFYKENQRFQIAYDSAAVQHYLTEVNPEEIDELEGGKPLEPK